MSVDCRPEISCDKTRLHTLSVISRVVVPKSIEPWCKLSQGWAFLHVCVRVWACLSKGISTWSGQISSVLPAIILFRPCVCVTKRICVCEGEERCLFHLHYCVLKCAIQKLRFMHWFARYTVHSCTENKKKKTALLTPRSLVQISGNTYANQMHVECSVSCFGLQNVYKYVSDVTWWVVHLCQHGFCVGNPNLNLTGKIDLTRTYLKHISQLYIYIYKLFHTDWWDIMLFF